MKKLLMLLWAAIAAPVSHAQDSVKEISLGEPMVFDKPLGRSYHDDKQINLKDYRGKIIILDFWGVTCAACIKAFPKMDSLQSMFGEHLQIIAVTQDSKEQVMSLFKRIKKKVPSFPMIVEDKWLNQVFPHFFQPHHVWIDKKGIVRYITHGYNATEKHIKALLEGQQPKMSFSNHMQDFDDKKPLINEAGTRLQSYAKYYSLLLSHVHDTLRSFRIDIERDSITNFPFRIKAINAKILTLFQIAYNRDVYGFDVHATNLQNNKRVAVELKNPFILRLPTDPNLVDEWRGKNIFSYEVKVPAVDDVTCYRVMQRDLNLYFNYYGSINVKNMHYLAIVADSSSRFLLKTDENKESSYSSSLHHFSIKNYPFSFFLEAFLYANQFNELPIVDETNIKGKVTMILQSGLTDLDKLKVELSRYGMKLVAKEGDIKVLVIRDR